MFAMGWMGGKVAVGAFGAVGAVCVACVALCVGAEIRGVVRRKALQWGLLQGCGLAEIDTRRCAAHQRVHLAKYAAQAKSDATPPTRRPYAPMDRAP